MMPRTAILTQLAARTSEQDLAFSPNIHVALKIRTALADPECHVEEAAHLVQAEPLLAARMVAMANSLAYNRSGREIADVRTAVSRLGYQVIRNLAMALVVRQMAQAPTQGPVRDQAARLWEYTLHMTALARLVAREVTGQDPEIAAFAALMHDLGGFFLLSRAQELPGLLDGALNAEELAVEIDLTRRLLSVMQVPASVITGIEDYWAGQLGTQPASLGDTLLLAAHLAPVRPPLHEPAGSGSGLLAAIDGAMSDDTRQSLVEEADEAVGRLRDMVADAEEELSSLLTVMQY